MAATTTPIAKALHQQALTIAAHADLIVRTTQVVADEARAIADRLGQHGCPAGKEAFLADILAKMQAILDRIHSRQQADLLAPIHRAAAQGDHDAQRWLRGEGRIELTDDFDFRFVASRE